MRISSFLTVGLTFLAAAGACLLAASFLARGVEESTEIGLREVLDGASHDWAEVQADGLQVIMSGTAPDEARRQLLRGIEQLSQALRDPDSRAQLDAATRAVLDDQHYQALRALRALLPREARLLAGQPA